MKITHVLADGRKLESIKGVTITNDDFYRVLQGILEKNLKGEKL